MRESTRKATKTKEKFIKAMLKLGRHYYFKDITVTDICKEAGLSRDTFYAYYLDKFDLLQQFYDQHVEKISGEITGIETIRTTIERTKKFLDFFDENRQFIINMKRDEYDDMFQSTFFKGTKEIIVKQLTTISDEEAIPESTMVYIDFNVYGLLGITEEWIRGKFRDKTSMEIARIVVNAMPEDMKKRYRGDNHWQ